MYFQLEAVLYRGILLTGHCCSNNLLAQTLQCVASLPSDLHHGTVIREKVRDNAYLEATHMAVKYNKKIGVNGACSVRGIPRIYGVYPVNLFSIY